MVRKAVIGGSPEGDWYSSYMVEGSGFLREENVERRIYCCASSRSGLGVESVDPKSKAFRTILRRHLSFKLR